MRDIDGASLDAIQHMFRGRRGVTGKHEEQTVGREAVQVLP